MVDVFTLAVASVVTTNFWCAFFGVHDRRLAILLAAASLIESIRRMVIARRGWSRPHTFCEWRRLDLLVAIVLAAGPWPIAEVFSRSGVLLINSIASTWLAEAAVIGAVSVAIARLAATLGEDLGTAQPRTLRQLQSVPDVHVASMAVLYNGTRA